jgi:mono/diheme cytochrome c family protein
MRALKTVLLLTMAVSLTIACSTSEPTTSNANRSTASAPAANTNSSTPSTPAVSTANSNQSGAQTAPGTVSALAIYEAQKCGLCHGADGKGKVKGVPDFSDKAWQQKTTDAAMVQQIKKGKLPQMPPYEGKLNDIEIGALVAYIRTFGK